MLLSKSQELNTFPKCALLSTEASGTSGSTDVNTNTSDNLLSTVERVEGNGQSRSEVCGGMSP